MEGYPQNPEGTQQQYPQQPYPPPGYQPPAGYPVQGYPPKKNVAEDLLKNPMYVGLAIAISILLIWLGLLFHALMFGETDQSTMMNYLKIGMILYNLGMAGLVMTFLFVGLGRHDYPQWVRFALIFGAVLLTVWGFMNIFNLIGGLLSAFSGGGYHGLFIVF